MSPQRDAKAAPTFDSTLIRMHVGMLHSLAAGVDGVLTVSTIMAYPDSDKQSSPVTSQFAVGHVEETVAAIMAHAETPNQNVYMPWCVFRRDLPRGKKGGEDDVVCSIGFVADMDHDNAKGGTLPLPAPYVMQTSGKNVQAVYPLARALPRADAKPLAVALCDAAKCDSRTKDISGVFRVAGTMNWPDKKKLDRGRPREPQLVNVVTPWAGDLTEPEVLKAAIVGHCRPGGNEQGATSENPPDVTLLMMRLKAALKKLITSPPGPDEDRSAIAASVMWSLMAANINDEGIQAIFEAHPNGIGQRYTPRSLSAEIARLREKFEDKRKKERASEPAGRSSSPSDPSGARLPELSLDDDPVAVAKKLAKLIAENSNVLLNGYTPVRVLIEAGQEPRAVPLTTEAVRACAFEICRCVKTTRGDDIVDAPLRRDHALIYLNGLEGEWGLRPLRGISTSPLLGDDGSIRTANGYDGATGLWCHGVPSPLVPHRPTKDEAERALLLLRQTFCTFPFDDAAMTRDAARGVDVVDLTALPQLDESTHLVALMTSVCRACLSLAPGFLYDASAISGAGTGKGLLVKSACAIGTGTRPHAMGAGHSAEELDKRLVSAAIAAQPAIYLDNFNEGMLESDTLASMLTEDPAQVRLLGQSKTVPLNTRAFITITGNAVQIAEDMARRILRIGLDARMENPEQRPFEPGFLQGIFSRRADLLSACLTVWRWGVQQGDALPRGRPIGSYEQWARWCRDPLLQLGCRDPIDRITDIKAADPRRRHLAEVFALWWQHHNDQPVTAADLNSVVKEAIDVTSKRIGDELHFSRQKVAAFLRSHTNSRVGGFHLQLEPHVTTAQGNAVARYRLLRDA